jgi:DNA-binding transcriptional ArsR family regulator
MRRLARRSSGIPETRRGHDACSHPCIVTSRYGENRASGDRANRVADVLKAVAHPLRLGIIMRLARGEEHVCDLAAGLRADQPQVSNALRILRLRGLVAVTRTGGHARYRLHEDSLRHLAKFVEGCTA